MKHKMVGGKVLYTDSTHLKASANKNKFERQEVEKSTCGYIDDLDKDVSRDREKHGKKPLKEKEVTPQTKSKRISTTDPQSGYMLRPNKPEGFYYLDHRTVDDTFNIITDVHITPGNVHDSVPYLNRLDRQRERFKFSVESVGLDAGYFTAAICKGLEDRGLYGVMPYHRPGGKKGMLKKTKFTYDEHSDCYLCPEGKVLSYKTTTRKGYRQYHSNPTDCSMCPLLKSCTSSRAQIKVISRHIWQDYKEEVQKHRLEEKGKRIYKRRKETVERSFADAKQLHGHRYACVASQK
jgi:hypothetical protein